MCFDTDGYVAAYQEAIRKARKPHRCNESCGNPINVGDLYVSFSGIYDDGPFSGATCGACELTRQRIHKHELAEGCHWNESWCPSGELRDYCVEAEFAPSTPEEGQAYLQARKAKATEPRQ